MRIELEIFRLMLFQAFAWDPCGPYWLGLLAQEARQKRMVGWDRLISRNRHQEHHVSVKEAMGIVG